MEIIVVEIPVWHMIALVRGTQALLEGVLDPPDPAEPLGPSFGPPNPRSA